MTDQATSPTPRRSDRRESILATASELFAANGIGPTTVREIGGATGLLSGSLYHHFDSKEAMAREIVGRFLTDIIERQEAAVAANPDPRARFEALIRASFESIAADHNAAVIYQNDFAYLRELDDFGEFDELTGRFQTIWTATIAEGVESGVFRGDVDERLFYRLARDAVWFSVRWYRPDGELSIDDAVAGATTIFLDGFATSA